MSRAGEKRMFPSHNYVHGRKRRKGNAPRSEDRNHEPIPRKKDIRRASAKELPWREVTPPGRLEDAEGFLGLEEVEDVEVVRNADGKDPSFRVSVKSRKTKNEVASVIHTEEGEAEADGEEDGEWSGFSEEDEDDDMTTRPTKAVPARNTARREETTELHAGSQLKPGVAYKVLEGRNEEQNTDTSQWEGLGLSGQVLDCIAGLSFNKPTPIQRAVIPQILSGSDVIGKAVTGSGKTLAFAIPILDGWLKTKSPGGQSREPTVLILTPTRELAHQVARHFEDLVEPLPSPPKITTVTGGLSIQKQKRQLENVDIIIATPGRLWEVMNDSEMLVSNLKMMRYLVVDEADRLLSVGHFQEVEQIMNVLDRVEMKEDAETGTSKPIEEYNHWRRTLVFSATFHKGLQGKLKRKSWSGSEQLLTDKQSMDYLLGKLSFRDEAPKFIDVNPESHMAEKLKESLVECPAMEKDLYLYSLLLQHPGVKILVFTNSISSVRRLASLMQNLNIPINALHSSMPQKARLRNVERFSSRDKTGTILIATDVAARGLDIPSVGLILHYHVPRSADIYIHRSGRTARVNNVGQSVLLSSPDEVAGVTKLIASVHSRADSDILKSMNINRNLLKRLKPRISLAQKITESTLAAEKTGSQDNWLRNAAEELGVEYDSDEFHAQDLKQGRGRGSTKREKQKKVGQVDKGELAQWKAQLEQMLNQHVNLGVSERYLAGGAVDVDALLGGDFKDGVLRPRKYHA